MQRSWTLLTQKISPVEKYPSETRSIISLQRKILARERPVGEKYPSSVIKSLGFGKSRQVWVWGGLGCQAVLRVLQLPDRCLNESWSGVFFLSSFGVEVIEDDHESETARCDERERDLDRQRYAESVCAGETDRQP